MLVNSRKHTRSRTYDFLLKGLIFCHECGYPMAVLTARMPPVRIACSLSAGPISDSPRRAFAPVIPLRKKR